MAALARLQQIIERIQNGKYTRLSVLVMFIWDYSEFTKRISPE
jgi:hypothetical protein